MLVDSGPRRRGGSRETLNPLDVAANELDDASLGHHRPANDTGPTGSRRCATRPVPACTSAHPDIRERCPRSRRSYSANRLDVPC